MDEEKSKCCENFRNNCERQHIKICTEKNNTAKKEDKGTKIIMAAKK
jgi:hypothetical protein